MLNDSATNLRYMFMFFRQSDGQWYSTTMCLYSMQWFLKFLALNCLNSKSNCNISALFQWFPRRIMHMVGQWFQSKLTTSCCYRRANFIVDNIRITCAVLNELFPGTHSRDNTEFIFLCNSPCAIIMKRCRFVVPGLWSGARGKSILMSEVCCKWRDRDNLLNLVLPGTTLKPRSKGIITSCDGHSPCVRTIDLALSSVIEMCQGLTYEHRTQC